MSYCRISILGSLAGGEVWSINPVYDPTLEFPGTIDQGMLDAAATAIAALNPGTQLMTYVSSAGTLTGARVEMRDDVSDALLGISTANRGTALPGTTAPTKPAQTAVVFSLRTNTPGGSGRGRVYWPALGASMGTDLRIPSAQVFTAITEMKTYLNGIRSALATAFPTIGFDLAVRSRTTHTTPHVVRMQAGNVLDTQRRRRDNLPEAYQQVTIP